MVAIVAGNGMGLQRSSANILGAIGLQGKSALGRSGETAFVNASNGNLVIQDLDERLIGLGPDAAAADAGIERLRFRSEPFQRLFGLEPHASSH